MRAAELLDYTLGGHDFDVASAAYDIGSADEIHGESGDDFVYGMVGNDVLFGEGQDDDLIGGYGHDWISGGTGIDGVLGDDGRIYTSRNIALESGANAEVYSEALYGILRVDEVNKRIDTPGNLQVSYINLAYELKKTFNLTPFNVQESALQDPLYNPMAADDLIYGGLGSDFLHGGAGDDAISGAEALPEYYDSPYNPGDLLRWGQDRAGEFAAYDEYNPLARIEVDDTGAWTYDYSQPDSRDFYLNFDETEGVLRPGGTTDLNGQQVEEYFEVNDDGRDVIFGDLGNDWLVGGTGVDHLWGGRGDDLLNADDDHTSDRNANSDFPDADHANDTPDTHPTYQDTAYGGAGRDVLVGNTGGDRLIDWTGEFNSFLVPFAPFGAFAISRNLQPGLMAYLYDLSEGDGADPTRAYDTGNDEDRNGEPDGEIGLVNQKDDDWGAQTGAPDDIQPGNIPGGSRDVLRGTDFNNGSGTNDADGTLFGFAADSGSWTVEQGRLSVSPDQLGGDAASVFYVDSYLPIYFEVQATINAAKPIAGWKSNAYIIFDYQSPTDFKFAGVNVSTDKFEMGIRTAAGWIVLEQKPLQVKPDTDYRLLLAINGLVATLVVDGELYFTHVFEARIDEYGISWGLNGGMVGLGAQNSTARIDNLKVQILPPEITLNETETFDDGVADFFTPVDGAWQVVAGEYVGEPAVGDQEAFSAIDIGVRSAYLLRVSTVLRGTDTFGLVFDRYSATDYKFAVVSPTTDQVIIGHYSVRTGYVVDAVVTRTISPNSLYSLEITLKGTTVSVAFDGQIVLGHAFNSLVVDGQYGVFTNGASAAFDDVTVMTDDPQYDGPVNSSPFGENDAFTVERDSSLLITAADLLANDTDADGDPLTITNVSQPLHGALSDNGDGTWTYTPASGYVGGDSFSYRISDGQGGSAIAQVAISVTGDNAPPVAVDDSLETDEGVALTFSAADLLANDSDPDGDALTIVSVGQPDNGTVTDNGDGTWTYTPNPGFGVDVFSYVVTDGNGGTATATVYVTVNDVPDPTPNNSPTPTDDQLVTDEDVAVTFSAADLLGNDSDPDGDTLTVSSVGQPSHGVVAIQGSGWTYTPNAGFFGTDAFTYTVSDGRGGSAMATVHVTVNEAVTVPDPLPTVTVGNASVDEGNGGTRTATVTVTLSSASSSTVTVQYQTADGSATVAGNDYQATSGTLTFAPGQTSMTISISVYGDKNKEGNETFLVVLTGATNATIAPAGQGTVTIVDEKGGLTAPAIGPHAGRTLTTTELDAAVAWAIAEWLAVEPSLDLAGVTFVVGDLDGALLGEASDGLIVIDADAAGWGWSIAGGQMDLLTVVRHEIGHLIGLAHAGYGLMAEMLAVGEIFEVGSPVTDAILAPSIGPLPTTRPVDLIAAPGRPTAQLLMSVGVLTGSTLAPVLSEIDRLPAVVAEVTTTPAQMLVTRIPVVEMPTSVELPRAGRLLPAGEVLWMLLALCWLLHRRRRSSLRHLGR